MTCDDYLKANPNPTTLFALSRGERAAALAHMLTCPACAVMTQLRPPTQVTEADKRLFHLIAEADEQDAEFAAIINQALANSVQIVAVLKAQ